MPIYEFTCPLCSSTVQLQKPITEPLDVVMCPPCNTVMNRNYSAPGIVFRGTGWGKD